MGAASSRLEKALGEQFPKGERYFGLENFDNTCYCNNVLQRAVSKYLPVVLGLTMKESRLEASVEFRWKTLDDDDECCLVSAWYEVLSIVHMMAMLALFEANLILIPKNGQAETERKVSEAYQYPPEELRRLCTQVM